MRLLLILLEGGEIVEESMYMYNTCTMINFMKILNLDFTKPDFIKASVLHSTYFLTNQQNRNMPVL